MVSVILHSTLLSIFIVIFKEEEATNVEPVMVMMTYLIMLGK